MIWEVNKFIEEYANPGKPTVDIACLLISGWSFDATIFEWLLPGLAQRFDVSTANITGLPSETTIEVLVDELAAGIQKPTWLIGWSMGGNVAIEIAVRYPEKVLGLCLISTTPHFIETPEWLVGMQLENFANFQKNLLIDVNKALHKFDLLQTRGDAAEKQLRHALLQYRQHQDVLTVNELSHGLKLLGEFDQREKLKNLKIPMFWCFGELDALVNAYTAYEIKSLCPLAEVQVYRQTTHALFLTNPDKLFRALIYMLEKDKVKAEKRRISSSFSRVADQYEVSAILQRSVAEKLIAMVEYSDGYLLDAGCGTGYALQKLAKKSEKIIGLDIAHGMLQFGMRHYSAMKNVVESDIECLPFSDHCISQIFSSLAIQWSTSISKMLEEWDRVLKPGGKAYIATLGENTLHELKRSWRDVDGYRHVNRFISAEELCEEVYQSPFVLKSMGDENHVFNYESVKSLMVDLKAIGAQTVVQNDVKGLTGKNRFFRLEESYEKYRNEDGLLPATYEVIYMVLEKHS